MLGYGSPDELMRSIHSVAEDLYIDPDERKHQIEVLKEEKLVLSHQSRIRNKDKHEMWMQIYSRPVFDDNGALSVIDGMAIDITQQKTIEEEQKQLEQKLQQSQKMESIGRLAGGIAHDFNNMLGIILGYGEILQESIPTDSEEYESVLEIISAANRSADLTHKLLAFARRQAISPKTLEINNTISGMLKMLQRLLSEEIELIWTPGEDLPFVKIDPTQLDQILANLCINGRDAITGNGKIIIETRFVEPDEGFLSHHPSLSNIPYVMLTVSDTGSGMDKETQSHIFEPFYTTKSQGKGTGLGLATVYGIVTQNNGFIYVYSEPGEGTSFQMYFPAIMNENQGDEQQTQESRHVSTGSETILLVEDEESLLYIARKILKDLGYSVVATNNPLDAIDLVKNYKDQIDLLITDVIMPELNGKELVEQIHLIIPDLKFLYMSGYSSSVIAHKFVLDKKTSLIQKPFSKKEISKKIREILDS
jgi:PAS domain S-box-containing protein